MDDFKELTEKGLGELQKGMERFETYNDGFILPDSFIVIRLDAHRMGDWGLAGGEYPCGPVATKAFHQTAIGLMTSAYRVSLAYHHGDEISLLVDPTENNNPLRRSKLISAFSSSAAVSLLQSAGVTALFDARISELPSRERALEYFLWQRRYCYRNAITVSLRKALLEKGESPQSVEKHMHGVSESSRLEKLAALGTPLSQIAPTTRRGALFIWDKSSNSRSEQFCIRTHTTLPESDSEFLSLIASGFDRAVTTTARIEHPTEVPRKIDVQQQPLGAKSPSRRQQNEHAARLHQRSNVSVFKKAGN